MTRRFAKYEGLGNDFVVIEPGEDDVSKTDAVRMCDRRFGVGADGVLVVTPHRELDATMRVINADGSIPEMCGNGIRCVALHLAIARGVSRATFTIATDAGPRACVVDRSDLRATVRVDMGRVKYSGDRALDVAGERVVVALGDAGNPHAIVFGAFDDARVEKLGRAIATHASFPGGVNAELANVRGDAIDLVVWERGVGRTLACGTGACATAACAFAKKLVKTPRVRVSLPGGELDVEVGIDDASTFMTGPARLVFRGEIASEVEP